MSIDARVTWLTVSAFLLLIGPGLIMVAGLAFPVLFLVESFLDLAHQPIDSGQPIDTDAARLLNAILGGILVGFGTLIWRVADKVLRNDFVLGQSILLPALIGWFICDSLGSILAGAWFNAVLNAVIVAVLLVPLLWKRAEVAA